MEEFAFSLESTKTISRNIVIFSWLKLASKNYEKKVILWMTLNKEKEYWRNTIFFNISQGPSLKVEYNINNIISNKINII